MILVQIPTEISYWGSNISESDVERIADNLEHLIRSEFSDAPFEIQFERTATPIRGGVHCDDGDFDAEESVRDFIQNNWDKAL